MSYYQILGLEKEPFSTSPDPDFFYQSQEHQAALTRLMIEIRLRRGLSVILGDVGTGKTTLSRKMFQMLKLRDDMIFFMILDPTFETEEVFLESLIRTFQIQMDTPSGSVLNMKEAIKKYLFQKAIQDNKTVILLVDEAQKLNPSSLEILRVLLNYETNEYKLLQLVLLAQLELLPKIREMKNLMDRISMKYIINPLDDVETKEMIEFRIRQAGYRSHLPLFKDDAIAEIYQLTQGYPRKISMLCHNALKMLVMESKIIVDKDVVHKVMAQSAF
ncbi:MAG: AAA family ATPase [Candidatus Omnitrophota bacterium]|jgi:type II secretory pathway predicted ATPase ExeA|nr:AAA family ATPase [Candidatus Omnitrophota bacterium]MDD5138565.1 AAA family ATPase [Candidatus Omnitrophota bacterium]